MSETEPTSIHELIVQQIIRAEAKRRHRLMAEMWKENPLDDDSTGRRVDDDGCIDRPKR